MQPASEKSVILIVDDIPANLGILTDFLDEAGLDVLVAQDGESALQKLAYINPNLILLDVMMPGIDGFETYRRIKKIPSASQIPVIFITALAETSYKIEGLSLGAVDYITKPFQKEEVLARINLHLELRRLHQTLEEKNQRLLQEIEEHTLARTALQNLTEQLEMRVIDRTTELSQTLQELDKSQAKLYYDAFHDSLTNLPNRAWLINRLKHLIEAKLSYGVLFIDLDRFKVVNDSLGHLIGDELLKCVAERMRLSLADSNTAVRLGGDEFVILIETGQATEIAEHLLRQLRLPFCFKNYEIFMAASIGITLSTKDYFEPMEVLRDADLAMYRAKQESPGSYKTFDPQMQAIAIRRMELEQDLRRAILGEELCLHYQPIFCLKTEELKGFEALVRWNHPQGIISPAKFIPIAEETGLINPLGLWVFKKACQQLRRWQDQFPGVSFKVNVNFSPIQFKQPKLIEHLAQTLLETKINKNSLNIEITETCLFNTPQQDLHLIKKLGIGLCLDDFGTGYSSLSRLQEFPVDTLKIDQSFVQRLSPNSVSKTSKDNSILPLIQTILLLGQSLGMKVVAEGIETKFQLETLKQLGCDSGQGYFLSKPLDTQTATKLLTPKLPRQKVEIL